MVSTRSKTAQTHLEDFATNKSAQKPKPEPPKPSPPKKTVPEANTSRKRKSTDEDITENEQISKRSKTSPSKPAKPKTSSAAEQDNADDKLIITNRAPVLHLWSACIVHAAYPNHSWETCLSAGSAISTICAVAKGRSIGTVPEKDDSETKTKKSKKKRDGDEIKVMHFRLRVEDRLAVVGSEGKGKPGDEEALRRKFGEGEYERVRSAFDDALKSWKGDEEELNKRGFGMYEEFRPDVSKGQKGWGRKGELRLENVRSVVEKQ